MAKRSRGIFRKQRLTPGQLRAVAERRFDDALCLLASGQNARANGAMYMAGFTIECLLKARLLAQHPNLQVPVDPATLSEQDREVHAMLFSHDLDAMLIFLPEVEKKLSAVGSALGRPVWRRFGEICAEWTVYARYSPQHANVDEARRFIETVREVKQWLRDL
ncbi:MAG: hypothetical protein ACREIT_04730 [Tepidisphaeraceae bacterium]